jgi:hypothetical protein
MVRIGAVARSGATRTSLAGAAEAAWSRIALQTISLRLPAACPNSYLTNFHPMPIVLVILSMRGAF